MFTKGFATYVKTWVSFHLIVVIIVGICLFYKTITKCSNVLDICVIMIHTFSEQSEIEA